MAPVLNSVFPRCARTLAIASFALIWVEGVGVGVTGTFVGEAGVSDPHATRTAIKLNEITKTLSKGSRSFQCRRHGRVSHTVRELTCIAWSSGPSSRSGERGQAIASRFSKVYPVPTTFAYRCRQQPYRASVTPLTYHRHLLSRTELPCARVEGREHDRHRWSLAP